MPGLRAAPLLLALAVALSCGETPRAQPAPGAHAAAAPRWVAHSDSKLARTEVAAARVGRFVYVIGGFEQRSGETTAAVERYDLARDRWSRVADLPVALNHAAAAASGGKVYVAGGYRGRRSLDDEVATLYRYDPATDRWSALGEMPTARGALALTAARGRLYAVGGASTGAGALATVEVYDIARRRWSQGPPLARAREHLAAASAGGRPYALAGRAAGQGNFAIAEVLAGGRWRRLPDMVKPRGGIAAAAVGGRVVVVGGEEGAGTIREVERYDPRRRRWSRLAGMRTPRHGLGAVVYRGRVYAIEGGDQPGFFFTRALESLRAR